MTGFVNPDGNVWGRPAGVCVGADGAIYVTDDLQHHLAHHLHRFREQFRPSSGPVPVQFQPLPVS